MALVAVIAVTAVVAASCTKSSGGSDKPTAAPTTSGTPTSDFASANDTGPVSVITEDPSCAPWLPINNTLADAEGEWVNRDASIPASAWGPELRAQYTTAARAIRNAADQTAALVKVTNHRVVRELYEQFIAYSRAYVERIATYTPPDDNLALASIAAATVLTHICQAITNGAAAARGPLVASIEPPDSPNPPDDPAHPERFLLKHDSACDDWKSSVDNFGSNPAVVAWVKTDASIPASQWPPEQQAANDAVSPVMTALADELQQMGNRSDNATFQDIAALSGQYQRAYVKSMPTYSKADENLYGVARISQGVIISACNSATR
ncbi:hypothetical protein H7J86_27190 [Mycobacterium hackensackense]|uniref:hypothetical protein n=1 Tax=Mycobacterium hackensackense TaxID=228909 RepID=UPI002265AA5C|nr:hypothetical protein [Mycobacterium hackensackense]MCV7255858.1 hypothetical protein [Mycobacterium hackensackense]